MGTENYRDPKTLWAGLALCSVGALLLLDQLGMMPARWFSFWAAVFLGLGLLKIIQSDQWTGRVWGVLLLLVAAALEIDYIGYISIPLYRLWPVLVIAAGIGLLLRNVERPREPVDSSEQLNLFNVMGGGEYRVRTKNFRGGHVTAFLGGFQIDLTDAGIEGNEATLDVRTILGGGEIRVPETWAVVVRASALAGGYSVKAREGQVDKTLVIRGVAILGGVEIRN